MPGNLEWKQVDPNRKGRGRGWYWHRGKGVYSLYTGKRDAPVHVNTTRIRDAVKRKYAQMNKPHKHDYKPKIKSRRTANSSYKGHPVGKTPKGFY